jgi:NTP pyrophosphatase (non-canonical NTP hydrolase)
MELKNLQDMQVALDEANGFPIKFVDTTQQYDQITKDLVGLMGEIGEFANIVKKINIKLSRPNEYQLDLVASQSALSEELADALIYILRISAMLEVDLEGAVLNKIRVNRTRYASLRPDRG